MHACNYFVASSISFNIDSFARPTYNTTDFQTSVGVLASYIYP
jgi:hypothetical protein